MCCSTGVCGPSVDPKLVRFAADLDWLKAEGIPLERINLAQQPLAFAQDAEVKAVLESQGEAGLPLIKVDGKVVSTGTYPTREQLAVWVGLGGVVPSIYSEAVQELVAIGAAVASNCEPCFKFHFDKARKLGVSKEDMLRAVRTAQSVKESPAKAVLGLAERYLTKATPQIEAAPMEQLPMPGKSGCCGDSGCC
jgi:AhpD family alkylhydroperoxidase